MPQDFRLKKRAILIALGFLITADAALGVYSYELASAPRTQQKEIKDLDLRLKILTADANRAEEIKEDMPQTKKDCDKFEHSLPAQSIGSSSMTADLDELAKKAGLQIVTQTYREKAVESRHLAEVSIDVTVNGDYASVARFVNGLQRSDKFYIVDGLTLSTESQKEAANGSLRVALHLRTYFRETA